MLVNVTPQFEKRSIFIARHAFATGLLLVLACATGAEAIDPEAVDTQAADSESMSVTETTPPEETVVAEPAPPSTAAIEAAQTRFLRLRDEGRQIEATAAALQVATLTQERYGLDSSEIIIPLVNLAVMQAKTGELTAAEQNYRIAIGVIERVDGFFSPRLVNPLSGLGHTYNRAGRYDQAIEVFERALRLNNIELGFTNFQQFGIHDGLTESYVGLREYEDATFYQQTQVEIHQRKFGRDNPRVVPAMFKLAEWYNRAGNLEASALTYRSADRILREQEDQSSATRAEGMLGLARLYERQGNRPAAASTLSRGESILESSADPDPLALARVQVALGDLYIRDNKRQPALREYESAWANLSSDPEYADDRDEYFEAPVRVAGGPYPNATRKARGRSPETLANGYVTIRYTVDEYGRAQDVVVVESEPAGVLEDSMVNVYRRSRYRPRLDDGVAVPTENILGQHQFFYVPAQAADEPSKSPSRRKSNRGRLEFPGSSDDD